MKTLIKVTILILAMTDLTACGSGGGSSPQSQSIVGAQPSTPDIVATPTPVPTPTPAPTPQALTYYSRTTSLGSPGGYVYYTGSCMNYGINTYCWDDGEKPVFGDLYCSFWNIGDCTYYSKTDTMAAPTVLSVNLVAELTHALAISSPTTVLSGTPTNVSCTQTNETLDCGSFQIDLGQTPL